MSKRYVNLRLCIEESGIVEGYGLSAVRFYTVYDPSGVLGGELEITCRAIDLENKLKLIAPVSGLTTGTTSQYAPSSQYRVVNYEKGNLPLDMPQGVSAGGLLNTLASAIGVQSETTRFLGELIDDALTKKGEGVK